MDIPQWRAELIKQGILSEKSEWVPMTAAEIERWADIRWARTDPEVQRRYPDQFVVPYKQQIVAHGDDARAVLEEASRVTGKPVDELDLVGILDGVQEIPLDPIPP
jgi:hypothetical protein